MASTKIRVHELAKELSLSNEDMLILLRKEGIEVKSHLSSLDQDMAELVRDHVRNPHVEAPPPPPAPEPEPEPDLEAELLAAAADEPTTIGEITESLLSEEELVKRVRIKAATASKVSSKAVIERKPLTKFEVPPTTIELKPPIIVRELAEALKMKPNTLIQELMGLNVFAAITATLETPIAEAICKRHGVTLLTDRRAKAAAAAKPAEEEITPEAIEYADSATESRPPVVTFLGHVDHGKTSLLDRIRNTIVAKGEAGGITQHIGASALVFNGHTITFIDTPGHEAFTSMRARGANTTDIAVLVVAADDGFMPQTVEALSHAKAAEVPVIVALNKMDLPAANPDRVYAQMQQNGLNPEPWGGEVGAIGVSAATGDGVNNLLERILLEAEMLELKANAKLPGRATVLESQLEQGLGPTVNILVNNGTVRVGDAILCGHLYGRVKALIDAQGKQVKSAGPSVPVKLVGLPGMAECGAVVVTCADEKQAKRLAEERETKLRDDRLRPARQASLEDLFRQIEEESRKELKLIVKTDVGGTCEAVVGQLAKLQSQKVRLTVIHSGVGGITENDVLLAAASDAIIIGFHVRVNVGVNKVAQQQQVQIRLYSVIYELVEQVREALEGLLAPDVREEHMGDLQILQIFELTKGGKVCGCLVKSGAVKVGSKARVTRAGELIYNGQIASLRRFQEDVREVRVPQECGIRLDNFNDFEVGDLIDVYEYKETKARLT